MKTLVFLQKLRQEYETLINETKMVVTESERQYMTLIKSIDTEKIAKVSQVPSGKNLDPVTQDRLSDGQGLIAS